METTFYANAIVRRTQIVSMDYPIRTLLFSIALNWALVGFACGQHQPFVKTDWDHREDFAYPLREAMIEDLLTKHKLVGSDIAHVRALLGKPDYQEKGMVGYQLKVDFGSDIDPVYTKSLLLSITADSLVTAQEVREWRKEAPPEKAMLPLDDSLLKLYIGLLAALVALLGTLLTLSNGTKRDALNKVNDKKYKVYSEILDVLFDLIKKQKGLPTTSSNDMVQRFIDIKRDLLLYGNDRSVRKFFEWEMAQDKGGRRLWIMAELAALVRKDMGNRWTRITADDILKSLVSDSKNYEEFKRDLLKVTT